MIRERMARIGWTITGLAFLCLTYGFAFQQPWATSTWPWPDGPLSYLFVGSILAAVSVVMLWIAFAQEWRSAVGGVPLVGLSAAGMALYLFLLYDRNGERHLLYYAIGLTLFVLYCLDILFWARRLPVQDQRPLPEMVRASLWVFSLALIITAISLIIRLPHIFPWPLNADSSVMFGCIFLGASVSYAYAALQRTWQQAKANLLGFLAYDLVLLEPFYQHFAKVQTEHAFSLLLYTAILIYSAGLAIFYLFLNPATRLSRSQSQRGTGGMSGPFLPLESKHNAKNA